MGQGSAEVQRAHGRAQQRARQQLIEAHREEFRMLLEKQKAAEGIRTLRPRALVVEPEVALSR